PQSRAIQLDDEESLYVTGVWGVGDVHVVGGTWSIPSSTVPEGFVGAKIGANSWLPLLDNGDDLSWNVEILSVVGRDLDQIWVAGVGRPSYPGFGRIWRWNGATFAAESLELLGDERGAPDVTNLALAPSGDLFAVAGDRVLRSSGDGTWQIVQRTTGR